MHCSLVTFCKIWKQKTEISQCVRQPQLHKKTNIQLQEYTINEKSYQRSAGDKTTEILVPFQIFLKKKSDTENRKEKTMENRKWKTEKNNTHKTENKTEEETNRKQPAHLHCIA